MSTRSGLAQVDAAEDLVAVVAAAVAVNVARSVVHVLDHGRGADRRVAVYVVLLRRVTVKSLLLDTCVVIVSSVHDAQ